MKWINSNICYLGEIHNFNLLQNEFNQLLSIENIEYKDDQLSLQKAKDWDTKKFGREEWCSIGKPSNFEPPPPRASCGFFLPESSIYGKS